jgi:hypothetical protein
MSGLHEGLMRRYIYIGKVAIATSFRPRTYVYVDLHIVNRPSAVECGGELHI